MLLLAGRTRVQGLAHGMRRSRRLRGCWVRRDSTSPARRERSRHWSAPNSSVREAGALALTHLERHALVTFDAVRLERLVELHERLLGAQRTAHEAELWLEAARIWAALPARKPASSTSARKARKARAGIEDGAAGHRRQRTARILGHADRRRREQLRKWRVELHAWRGPKRLPQEEYLAHLMLARARPLEPPSPSRDPHSDGAREHQHSADRRLAGVGAFDGGRHRAQRLDPLAHKAQNKAVEAARSCSPSCRRLRPGSEADSKRCESDHAEPPAASRCSSTK